MANLFDWDPGKYALQIPKMDDEHKTLINLMNKLNARDEAKAPKAELLAIMNELAAFTTKHFKDEEEYFSQIPGYEGGTHKLIHRDLLKRVGEFVSSYQNGSDPRVNPHFFRFLKVWLAAHICGIDKTYAEAAHHKKSS